MKREDDRSLGNRCRKQGLTKEHSEMALPEFDFFSLIPDEVVLKIFEYLSYWDLTENVTPVSVRFGRLAKDPRLYKKVVFSTDDAVNRVDQL